MGSWGFGRLLCLSDVDVFWGDRVKLNLCVLTLLVSASALADVDPTFRQNNAIVLYDFAETSGNVIDKSKTAPQINLAPVYGGRNINRGPGYLSFDAPDALVSTIPADKITNACKASGAMSYEVWLENNETVIERAGFDSANDNAKRPHPLRILNLSQLSAGTNVTSNINGTNVSLLSPENLYKRNFVFGQFYEDGNEYLNAIRTTSNEKAAENNGNSLADPLASSVAQTIVPDPAIDRLTPITQKVVFTLGASGVGRLYLSDVNGNMYLAREKSDGFKDPNSSGNILANWHTNAYLSLGNTAMTKADFDKEVNLEQRFRTCTSCYNLKNRYWKGKLKLVAVYCKELTREQVLGPNSVNNVLKNTPSDIDLNARITDTKLRAQEIFNRLTGAKIPVTDTRIIAMEREILNGSPANAAAIATDDARFLNVTVRDFAAKMSNRDQTVNTPLNDFIATIIGVVRDNINAKDLLTKDITYVGDPAQAPIPTSVEDDILRSNNHYQALENGRFDLGKVLKQDTQKLFDGKKAVPNPSPAGLLTSRQWLAEHAIAGTNRRLIEYTFKEFLCTPLENVADSSGPDNVVGPDIDRFPGGSHTKFTTTCRACHTILDGFRPAYARWTFGNGFAKHAFVVQGIGPTADENTGFGMQINPLYAGVTAKINRNSDVFPDGRRTVDENWVNNAVYNANISQFKFNIMSGKGVAAFGQTIANSPKFPRCMAERVFRQVCKRDFNTADAPFLDQVASDFTKQSYSLKYLFQKIVTSDNCLGGQ